MFHSQNQVQRDEYTSLDPVTVRNSVVSCPFWVFISWFYFFFSISYTILHICMFLLVKTYAI